MSGPPPPPRGRRANNASLVRQRPMDAYDDDDPYGEMMPAGAAYNVPRKFGDQGMYEDEQSPGRPKDLLTEEPETTIGPNVTMKGELAFERLLRIDGSFTGQLVSQGDLIIGPRGVLRGDIAGMGDLIIDGKLVGNVVCESVRLRGKAIVHGDINCKSLCMDPTVVVGGTLNVHGDSPTALVREDAPTMAPEEEVAGRRRGSAGGERRRTARDDEGSTGKASSTEKGDKHDKDKDKKDDKKAGESSPKKDKDKKHSDSKDKKHDSHTKSKDSGG